MPLCFILTHGQFLPALAVRLGEIGTAGQQGGIVSVATADQPQHLGHCADKHLSC